MEPCTTEPVLLESGCRMGDLERPKKAELARPRGQAYLLSCKEGAIALSDTHRPDQWSVHVSVCVHRSPQVPAPTIVTALYPSTSALTSSTGYRWVQNKWLTIWLHILFKQFSQFFYRWISFSRSSHICLSSDPFLSSYLGYMHSGLSRWQHR